MAHRIGLLLLFGWALAPEAVLLAAPGQSPGAGRPALRARADREAVLKLLAASERAPGEKELRALGGGVDAVLIALASDGKLESRMRARAVSALAHAPSWASREFLGKLVGSTAMAKDAADLLLIRRAAMALGWQGGPAAPPLLAGLLEHTDPEVRVDAALALGLTRLPHAAELLRSRLDVESDGRVRGYISRQLRIVENALGQELPENRQEGEKKQRKPEGTPGDRPPAKKPTPSTRTPR